METNGLGYPGPWSVVERPHGGDRRMDTRALTPDPSVVTWPIWSEWGVDPSLRHAEAPIPAWWRSWRSGQEAIVDAAFAAYQQGKRIAVLQAPTGFGKTAVAEAVRRRLGVCGVYLSETKKLQTQFADAFPYTAILKGRMNYPTADQPNRFPELTAKDCTRGRLTARHCPTCVSDEGAASHCFYCHPVAACEYRQAKRAAGRANLAALTTAYFLTAANFSGLFSPSPFVVVDECDVMERTLMGHIEVSLSAKLRDELHLPPFPFDRPPSLHQFLTPALEAVTRFVARWSASDDLDMATFQRLQRYESLQAVWSAALRLGAEDWVYAGQQGQVVYKPVHVGSVADQFFWQHGVLWLLMSATVVDGVELLGSLGITDPSLYAILPTPASTFPPARCPVVTMPAARMIYSARETAIPAMRQAVAAVVTHHAEHRVLIHTPSFDLAKALEPAVRGRLAFVHAAPRPSDELDRMIRAFKVSAPPGVLMGPGFDRGLDLPDDECRVQVVVKAPFASLGDAQVKARMDRMDGQQWYEVQAIRSFLQSLGRGMRAEDDWVISYVLDAYLLERLSAGRRGSWSGLLDRWYHQRMQGRQYGPFEAWLMPREEWPK